MTSDTQSLQDALQDRINNTRRELQNVDTNLKDLIVKRGALVSELAAYQRVLAAELRACGIEPPMNIPSEDTTDIEISKAEFIRRALRSHVGGATVTDIVRAFKDAGIFVKKPYIYGVLYRLKAKEPPGAIRSASGRWLYAEPNG